MGDRAGIYNPINGNGNGYETGPLPPPVQQQPIDGCKANLGGGVKTRGCDRWTQTRGPGYPSGRAVPVAGVLASKPIVRRFHRNAKGGVKNKKAPSGRNAEYNMNDRLIHGNLIYIHRSYVLSYQKALCAS